MTTVQAFISGRVQGVGFRYTTHYYAERLHITGSVKNLSDGRVELIMQGPQESIQKLLQTLKEQFVVSDIDQQMLATKETFTQFRVSL